MTNRKFTWIAIAIALAYVVLFILTREPHCTIAEVLATRWGGILKVYCKGEMTPSMFRVSGTLERWGNSG